MTTRTRTLDTAEVEERLKRMYEEVALAPEHESRDIRQAIGLIVDRIVARAAASAEV